MEKTPVTSDLLPCPFCGSADIDPQGWANSEGVTGPACNECSASAGTIKGVDNLAAWNRRSQPSGEPVVKTLEWKGKNPIRDNGDLKSDSLVGRYEIGLVGGRVMVILRLVRKGDAEDIDIGSYDTFDQAKAAAQADYEQRIRSAIEPSVTVKGEPGAWHNGEPPKHLREEWFIAALVGGGRVVLRALPEEWTFDYTTKDDTYYKADRIKKWMQFPDSEFVPYASPPIEPAGVTITDEMVGRASKAQREYHQSHEMSYERDGMHAALTAALEGK